MNNQITPNKEKGGNTMRADLYEKYYKRGLNHFMFKNVFGLHKPDKAIKRFYYALMVIMLVIGTVVF